MTENATQTTGDVRGRPALHELGELLQLRQRPFLTGVAGVVALGLLLTLLAPALVPANALVGGLVGIIGCVVGVAVAVVIDGTDPVLRGPRHLRRDRVPVLGRVESADVGAADGELVATLTRRIESQGRMRMLVVGHGLEPATFALGLGRAAAGAGLTSLVVDLTDESSAPGLADVGDGRVRLGEAATLAGDRPMAMIGAGSGGDGAAASAAAIALVQRPPSDLRLLLVVAPDGGASPELLSACDRTVVVVAADRTQRSDIGAHAARLRASGAQVECVVVGGGAHGAPLAVAPLTIGQLDGSTRTPDADVEGEGEGESTVDPVTEPEQEPVDGLVEATGDEAALGLVHEPVAVDVSDHDSDALEDTAEAVAQEAAAPEFDAVEPEQQPADDAQHGPSTLVDPVLPAAPPAPGPLMGGPMALPPGPTPLPGSRLELPDRPTPLPGAVAPVPDVEPELPSVARDRVVPEVELPSDAAPLPEVTEDASDDDDASVAEEVAHAQEPSGPAEDGGVEAQVAGAHDPVAVERSADDLVVETTAGLSEPDRAHEPIILDDPSASPSDDLRTVAALELLAQRRAQHPDD